MSNVFKLPKSKDLISNVIVGALAGLAVAAGGAFKDAPYEGFDYIKFPRSILIGALEAPIVAMMAPKMANHWLFFVVVGTERITTELYKVARKNRPNKFSVGEWGEKKCCTCSSKSS